MKFLFPNREVGLIQLMNITLLALTIILFAIDRGSAVYVAALIATTTLAMTLIPARLLGVHWLERLEPELLRVAYQGKWLGIWTALWFGAYTAMMVPTYYGSQFSVTTLLRRETILLTLCLLILAVLLSLSNAWSYAHVKWWKHINMLIWLVVPSMAVHLLLVGSLYAGVGTFWASWIALGLSAAAGISGVFRAKPDYFAWWRIWLLLIGVIMSGLVMLFYPAIV